MKHTDITKISDQALMNLINVSITLQAHYEEEVERATEKLQSNKDLQKICEAEQKARINRR